MAHVFTFGQVGTLIIVTFKCPVSRPQAVTECCDYSDAIARCLVIGIILSRCCLFRHSDVPSVDGRRGTSHCVYLVVHTQELTVLHFEWCGYYDRPLLGVDCSTHYYTHIPQPKEENYVICDCSLKSGLGCVLIFQI